MMNYPAGAPPLITPAEAQFWQDQAGKVPQMIRAESDATQKYVTRPLAIAKIFTMGAGVAMAVATFSKMTSGKWKWLSGAGALLSIGSCWAFTGMQSLTKYGQAAYLNYANALESYPEYTQELGQYLSSHVTAADIQQRGLETSVLGHSMEFAMIAPSLQNNKVTTRALEMTKTTQNYVRQ